ncbi:PDZ domain-containing protein [Flavobacterium undicola]|uniref:signal protein PDZ n=1 Tax=Flavobacterium undicola TaxID=1932779 RepID=UPI0013771F06|nr:signal protein PDZ [Flavobacterium undicola]MBA0884707.1 signal protein PDZ [Flavobacterium undicola]
MKKIILFFFLFSFAIPVLSQKGFEFVNAKSSRIKIPVKLINNLVFIPVEVNGVELLFLLDSGVEETILFGSEETQKVNFNQVQKINIRGLGTNEAVEGLKSTGNILKMDKLESKNHLLYLILDSEFNLSSLVGISVNGIIGSAAFKNYLVEIDYIKKMVVFHKSDVKFHKEIEKKYTKVPVSIESGKPYMNAFVKFGDSEVLVRLLIDSGNSDAIWLFDKLSDKIEVPEKYFDDYLGQGLSGVVEGKRARITEFSIADFKFNSPIVAFPDAVFIKNISLNSNRLGSLGGEILKRFSVVFDYKNEMMYLKKNKWYKSSFYYNKSGIEIWQTGVQFVEQMVTVPDNPIVIKTDDNKSEVNGPNYKYKVVLKPVYEIGYVRENSSAAKSGLRATDVLVAIDGKPAYNLSLQEINSHLWSEDEIWIELTVLREGNLLTFKFQLVNIL